MSVEIDPIDWQVRMAVMQGRVNRFDRSVTMAPPVVDNGIDLWRGRSRGVTGYEAEKTRRTEQRERVMEYVNRTIEASVPAPVLPVFDFEKPSIKVIQAHICQYGNVQLIDINSTRRTADVIKPRHIGMMLSKMLTPKSLPEIGRQFGGRDHTTVLAAVRKTQPLQKYILDRVKPENEFPLWVSLAFQGWDDLGI